MTRFLSHDEPQCLRFLLAVAAAGVRERGIVEEDVQRRRWPGTLLSSAVAEGLLCDEDGYLYILSAGEATLDELCRDSGEPSAELLEQFDPVDLEFKSAATSWQDKRLRENPAESVALVEEVIEINARTRELLLDYPAARPLVEELQTALDAFIEGDQTRLTSTNDDSYHSVWFLLHELLLRRAGRTREHAASVDRGV